MLTLALLLAIAPAPAEGSSADWPAFRGPNRDNLSPDTGLLKEWPKEGPKLLWTGEGLGKGYSSPAISGSHIFTLGDVDDKCFLFALNRADGKMLWKKEIGGASQQRNKNWAGSRSTPTVDGQFVYALAPRGQLVAAKLNDGEIVWSKDFKKDYAGSHGSWEYAESVLIDGDRLLCTPGGKEATVVCLDKTTGKEIWKSAAGGQAGYASIVISNAGGVKQYVTLIAAGTIGIDAQTGKRLWIYDKLGGNVANIPTPIVKGEQIFTLAGYGKGGALLSLSKKENSILFNEVYYETKLKNKHGGAVIVGDYVYADTDDRGSPYCANWKTGEVKWTGKSPKGRGSASLTYADGHLYIRYNNGVMVLVPADPSGYTEKGSFQIPPSGRSSWAHPVVIGGKLYLREDDKLYCYDVTAK
ncbi:MAG: PQQ-binding-like beta-propeller repeat protein [Gemmataceae bacterium]